MFFVYMLEKEYIFVEGRIIEREFVGDVKGYRNFFFVYICIIIFVLFSFILSLFVLKKFYFIGIF